MTSESSEGRASVEPAAAPGQPFDLQVRLVPAVAIAACIICVLSRALIPAMHGWVVGISRFLDLADDGSDAASQLLILALTFTTGAVAVELVRSRTPLVLRVFGVLFLFVGTFVSLLTLGLDRAPLFIHVVIGTSATMVALMFGIDALVFRRTTVRWSVAGVVPLAIGLASALRGVGAYTAERAAAQRRTVESIRSAFVTAEWLATVAALVAVAGSIAGGVQLVRNDKRRGGIAAGGALVVSLLLAWRGSAKVDANEGSISVLLRRFAQELLTLPHQHLPRFFEVFAAVLPTVLACFVVATARRKDRMFASGMALALLATASAETPLLAMCLAAGAVTTSLDRRDPEGIFAAMRRVSTPPPATSTAP